MDNAKLDTAARLDRVLKLIFRIAGGEIGARQEPDGIGDELDLIMTCLNMLGEELSASAANLKGVMEGLEARIVERTLALEDTNRELTRARDEAVKASRLKSDFLANMTHEIRTPLNGITGIVALLLETPLAEEQTELVRTIGVSGESLLTIINDILDLSKIEAGMLTIERYPFDPVQLVKGVTQLLSPVAAKKGIGLSVHCGPSVPRGAIADAGRLRQALTNLVGNAIKFTRKGDVRVMLVTEPSPDYDGAVLRVSVVDTGIGINANNLSRIFDKFTQADVSTTREYGGTGLGLAISKRLVELMGGTIGVESQEELGSNFWFTVPVGLVQGLKPINSYPAHTNVNARIRSRFQGRVLVAEDNTTNRKVACGLLTRFGCVVDIATNGREAIDRARETTYDLILMDCEMPIVDGFAAAAEIRRGSWDRHLPIVALTAHAVSEVFDRCREAGMDGRITKPLRVRELEKVLERFLGVGGSAATSVGAPRLNFSADVPIRESRPAD